MDLDTEIADLEQRLQERDLRIDVDKVTRIIRQLSVSTEYQADSLLTTMVEMFARNHQKLSLDDALAESLLNLFEDLSEHYTFEEFTARICPLHELIAYVEAATNSTVLSSLGKLLAKASPVDILANTALVKFYIQKLNSDNVSISMVNTAEILLLDLSVRGELIQRRLVSKEVVEILCAMRNSHNVEKLARLLDLVKNVYLEFIANFNEIPVSLVQFDRELSDADDIMVPLTILNFYNGVLETVLERPSLKLQWIVKKLSIEEVVRGVYFQEHVLKSFTLNEFAALMSKLSYLHTHDDLIREVKDAEIRNGSYYTGSPILASINPAFLSDDDTFFEELQLNLKMLDIFINLIGDEDIFEKRLVQKLQFRQIERIGSLTESLQLILALTRYKWSSSYLINKSPRLMHLLLDSKITNPELSDLKHQIMTNLMESHSKDELLIWYTPLAAALERFHSKTYEPQTTLADDTV